MQIDSNPNLLMDKYGLNKGDIFVGVEGYKVDNKDQYNFAIANRPGPDFEFVVWNGKEYRTVKPVLIWGRWDCSIRDYHGK